ncbi:MAG: hypothetical protein IID05_09085 [Gemmatimonadetes bacterium]|nr:hypothetical protein [Gemmatimonadota bacterium]
MYSASVAQIPELKCRITVRMLIAANVAVLAATPALAQTTGPQGCYDIHVGPWESEQEIPPTGPTYEPPSRVRFSDLPNRPDRGGWLQVAPNALPSPHRITSWDLRNDTLFLNWSTGFTGLRASLIAEGTGWRGEARSSGDVIPWPVERRSIRLEWADCETMPAVTAADDRYIRRSIDLNDGQALVLGEALPARADWTVRGSLGMTRLGGAIVGPPFGDAVEVVVRLNDDARIFYIGLRFSSDVTVSDLVDRLSNAMGSPTDRRQEPGPRGPTDMASWNNRTTRLFISRYVPDDPTRLSISDPLLSRR